VKYAVIWFALGVYDYSSAIAGYNVGVNVFFGILFGLVGVALAVVEMEWARTLPPRETPEEIAAAIAPWFETEKAGGEP
jgi:hypothetical protein